MFLSGCSCCEQVFPWCPLPAEGVVVRFDMRLLFVWTRPDTPLPGIPRPALLVHPVPEGRMRLVKTKTFQFSVPCSELVD